MNELTNTEQTSPADWEVVDEQQPEYISSGPIYIDPRYFFPDMSEEEAMAWNQPNPNPDSVWTKFTVSCASLFHREHYSIIEPWDPQKTPIKPPPYKRGP